MEKPVVNISGSRMRSVASARPAMMLPILLPVIRGLFPGQFTLDQGDAQILHNRSAAASSTASLLAKQKRR